MQKKPSLIETVCGQTVMSMRDLAIMSGGSQSTMSRYLQGTRSLPAQTMLAIVNMHSILKGLPVTQPQPPTQQQQNELLQRAAWCRAQCLPLQQKLQAMQQSIQQATTTLQLMDVLAADASLTKRKKNWLELLRYKAQKQLAANGWLAQKELSVKIALLTKEAEIYETGI